MVAMTAGEQVVAAVVALGCETRGAFPVLILDLHSRRGGAPLPAPSPPVLSRPLPRHRPARALETNVRSIRFPLLRSAWQRRAKITRCHDGVHGHKWRASRVALIACAATGRETREDSLWDRAGCGHRSGSTRRHHRSLGNEWG